MGLALLDRNPSDDFSIDPELQKFGAVEVPSLGAPTFLKLYYNAEHMLPGRFVSWIESQSFLEEWKKVRNGVQVPGHFQTWRKAQQRAVISGLTDGPVSRLEMAAVHYSDYGLSFVDGRHRTRAMIDLGVPVIPVDSDEITAANFKAKKSLRVLAQIPAAEFYSNIYDSLSIFDEGRITAPYYAES